MSMKNIGLSGLPIKQSKIPINPIKLVNVRMLIRSFNHKGLKDELMFTLTPLQAPLKKLMGKIGEPEELEEDTPEKEELDWWSKYYASLAEMERQVRHLFTCNKGRPSCRKTCRG